MFLILVLLLLLAGCKEAEPLLVIEHVNVVDVRHGQVLANRMVGVRGTRIVYVIEDSSAASGPVTTVDGRGKYLMPGLWDMHVHADSADLRRLVAWGVTGARDMGGAVARRAAWAQAIDRGQLQGPRLVYGGPVLAGPQAQEDEDTWRIATPEEAPRIMANVAASGGQFVKVHEGITRATLLVLLQASQTHNLRVVGHVPNDMSPVEAARAGMASIEHLEFVPTSCMGLFESRLTPRTCGLDVMDEHIMQLSRTGVWLDPTISSFRVWAPANFLAIMAGFSSFAPLMQRHQARLLAGTDLGDPRIIAGESLHDELALLVDAGFTPLEALRAATSNAVDFLGMADSLGAVEHGKLADLVLLEGNPLEDIGATRRIAMVIRNGVVIPR